MKRILTQLFFLVAIAGTAFAAVPKVQFVHNAADPQLDSVNLYFVDHASGIAVDSAINMKFRTATTLRTFASGISLDIGVAPTGSTFSGVFKTFNVGALADSNYVMFFNGVSNPANFALNPDGDSTRWNIYLKHNARFQAGNPTQSDLAFFHGVSDGPTIDVKITVPSAATLVNNLGYGDFQDYITVAPTTYIVKVTDAAGTTVLKTYLAPLATAQGAAAVVFASGFIDSTVNQNGHKFGLYAVTLDQGGNPLVFQLMEIKTSNMQLIHNAADTALATVDVYATLQGVGVIRKYDNVDFRSGTTFGDLPANMPLKIVITPKNGTGVVDSIKTFMVGPFTADSLYVAMLSGLLTPANYAANPDGLATDLNLYVHSGRTSAPAHKAALILFHGCTDAPTIDVKTQAPIVTTLVDNVQYGNYNAQGYLLVDSANYIIQLTDSGQTTVLKAYAAPLSLTVGAAAVVYASGFLNPATNSGGAAFTVQVTLPNAITLSLPEYVGINEVANVTGVQAYPNPANTVTRLSFNLATAGNVQFQLTSMSGEAIQASNLGNLAAGTNNLDINVANLANGMYMMTLVVDGHNAFTRPVVVNK